MKRDQEILDEESVGYHSTDYNAEVRTAFAKQYLAWKARGWKKEDFLVFLSEAGFSVPERTLTRWVAAVKQHGVAVSTQYDTGRPRMLSEEAIHIVVGYVSRG